MICLVVIVKPEVVEMKETANDHAARRDWMSLLAKGARGACVGAPRGHRPSARPSTLAARAPEVGSVPWGARARQGPWAQPSNLGEMTGDALARQPLSDAPRAS